MRSYEISTLVIIAYVFIMRSGGVFESRLSNTGYTVVFRVFICFATGRAGK
jgi:hypothetical protein